MKDFAPRTPAAKAAEPSTGKGLTLVDNRASTVAQRKLQEAIATSPRQVAQRQAAPAPPAASRPNRTGLPDKLKAGVESLSGHSLDDVKVHYNSSKPAQLQAHAYAQGTDIHLGPGQEKHLPHEAWHVVQQKQGRVRPTRQLKGAVPINDEKGLEKEADVMGARTLNTSSILGKSLLVSNSIVSKRNVNQLRTIIQFGGSDDNGSRKSRRPKKRAREEVADASKAVTVALTSNSGSDTEMPDAPSAAAATSTRRKARPQKTSPALEKRYKGEKGVILKENESLDSEDSKGNKYRVKGQSEHLNLSLITDEGGVGSASRQNHSTNLVNSALTVAWKTEDGIANWKTHKIRLIWNSGKWQYGLGQSTAAMVAKTSLKAPAKAIKIAKEATGAAPINLDAEQRKVVAEVLDGKNFNSQLHAHSEVAMAADPAAINTLVQTYKEIMNGVPQPYTILKVIIRVHSSPNSICMGACRGALEMTRKAFGVKIRKILDSMEIESSGKQRKSGRYSTDMVASSTRPFMNYAGNPAHKYLAAGEKEKLTEIFPRAAAAAAGKEWGGGFYEILSHSERSLAPTESIAKSGRKKKAAEKKAAEKRKREESGTESDE